MAALPESYVSLQQLRERWLVRQREGQGREGDDRKRLTGRRKQEKVSGKARVREEYGAGDIADRRKSYYWSQNKDGGGADGGGGKGPAAAVSEGFARERGCAGGSESMIGSYPPALGDGRKLPRGKEIEESSCFARAVVEDTFGEVVKRGECRPRNSDRGRIGFERSSSGPVRSKVEEAQGNGLRPSGRNKAGDRRGCGGSSGSRRERAAPVAEDEALERPNTKWSESEVSLGAQKSKIAPEDDGGVVGSVCFISAVAEESGGRKAEGEVFHVKKGKSKKKSGGKKRKVAGMVGAEEGRRGGNWQDPRFRRKEDGLIGGGGGGGGKAHKDAPAAVAEIVPLGQLGPRRLDSEVILRTHIPKAVPVNGLELPPEKELIEPVCFAAAIVAESSAEETKSEEYVRKSGAGCRYDKEGEKSVVVEGKEEDWVDKLEDDGHDMPAKAVKEEGSGSQMMSGEDLRRSKNCQWKGCKKNKFGVARIREEGKQVDKLADGHNLPLEAVTLPGEERVASEGKYLNVNGRIHGHGVLSGPRKNGLTYRASVAIRKDNEIQGDFSTDKEAVSKDVEPADMSSRTEGKLGYRQKNDMSSKETVFCNDEGEVTRKLRSFSIDSRGRRSDLNKRSSPAAKNSRSWGRGNPNGESGILAFRMERDMVWVKKGDALGGYNMDDVTRAN